MIRNTLLIVIIGFLFIGQVHTQISNTSNQPSEKRIALVIGNGNYNSSTLANPENDARSMAEVLQKLGFTVFKYENLTAGEMKEKIDDFGSKLKGNDVGLFYYAGHGIQAKGFNYLIPVDASLKTEEQVDYDCVRADRVMALMETSGTKVNIVILDACRNNPFERSWTRSATGRGLTMMNAPNGTVIAFSTAPEKTALDGSGKNSPYTTALLESLQIKNFSITQVFQNVNRSVTSKTEKLQTPWYSSSLSGDFYFTISQNQNNYQGESNSVEKIKSTNIIPNHNKTIDNSLNRLFNIGIISDSKSSPFLSSENDRKSEGVSATVKSQAITFYKKDSINYFQRRTLFFDKDGFKIKYWISIYGFRS
jgi:hypothetical protein